jgi:hypothetical protein
MSTVRAVPAPVEVGDIRPDDEDEDDDAAASLLVIRVARAAVLLGIGMRLTTWARENSQYSTKDSTFIRECGLQKLTCEQDKKMT